VLVSAITPTPLGEGKTTVAIGLAQACWRLGTRAVVNLRQSHAAKTHDALDRLPRISAPAHVICGAEDIFTPLRYSRAIADAIPGARLSVMPDVGHGMFWEATEAFNALVLDFLRGLGTKD
jgi:pimeloyl-ACP methyl ester carboxylesterase